MTRWGPPNQRRSNSTWGTKEVRHVGCHTVAGDFIAARLRGLANKSKDGPQARHAICPKHGTGAALILPAWKYRGDELAPCADRRIDRARCPCRPLGRPGRLAPINPPRRAAQHHHYRPAAKMPRAQPGRKRLAVPARQLALQQSLQILRRSRRLLLRGIWNKLVNQPWRIMSIGLCQWAHGF